MNKIAYIAPNKETINIGRMIFETGYYSVDIIEGNTVTCISKVEELIKDNHSLDVIMARGGTALEIRKRFNFPVIEVPITFEDLAEAILNASLLGKNIAIVGYYSLFNGLKLLNPLLNIEINQIFITDNDDMELVFRNLKKEGTDVIIGGQLQCQLAKDKGFKSVMLKSNYEAIQHAYKEAKLMVDSIAGERRRSEEIRTILDNSKVGYVSINNAGQITLINKTAKNFIPKQMLADNLVGKNISEIYPELVGLLDVLKSGNECLHNITSIRGIDVLYNKIPVFSDKGEVIGAIATISEASSITKGESKLRSKHFSKGLYAKYQLTDIIGNSPLLKASIEDIRKFASTDSTILLYGETGVGKELFAQGVHNVSHKKNGPFVGVNCASLPKSILESELFGYEKGAFTGARQSGKPGLFELAHEGSLFLDEISEIPLSLQGRLLRVVQEREVMRLGSDKIIPVNVRIVAATNQDLYKLVNEGKFREDLYFRINVLNIKIPALRDRGDDILLLANIFFKNKVGKDIRFTEEARELMLKYNWPGNVRELQNLMERIVVIHKGYIMDGNNLRKYLTSSPEQESNKGTRKELSRESILEALEMTNGHRREAAKQLGIHRTTLWRYLKRYNLIE